MSNTDSTGDNGVAADRAKAVNDMTTAMRKRWNSVKLVLANKRTNRLNRCSKYSYALVASIRR